MTGFPVILSAAERSRKISVWVGACLGLRWRWEIATVASLLRNDMFLFSFSLNDRIPCHLERSGAQSKDLSLGWCGACLGLRWRWEIATVASLLRNDMFIYLGLR